jgi:hypothetical protein
MGESILGRYSIASGTTEVRAAILAAGSPCLAEYFQIAIALG